MQAIKNITAHADYREAVAKLDSYREALTDARQLADKLDCERVAHDVKDFESNAIELADRLLSGVALQDNLSKRITETARKIEALRRAIELQQREVLRIRGEHSRRVCRDAVGEHVARVARVVLAVEEMHAANRDEQELRATIEAEGYSSTLLPAMAFLPRGEDYFDTRDVDGGYAQSWARDAADYIGAKALPVEVYEKQAAREAAAAPRRVPKPAARLSHPGEGEIVG